MKIPELGDMVIIKEFKNFVTYIIVGIEKHSGRCECSFLELETKVEEDFSISKKE
jgi:hypothetical protein